MVLNIGVEIRFGTGHMTEGKIGWIMENDSEMDYKVDFGSGWVGYYNRSDLKRYRGV